MQYQQSPLSRSTLTKRTPPEQTNTAVQDNNMVDEETGKTEEGINRKDWDALVSLVQNFAKDLSDLKLLNENIRTEQINIRKEQAETRKEIEELKVQMEKKCKGSRREAHHPRKQDRQIRGRSKRKNKCERRRHKEASRKNYKRKAK